MYNIWTEEMGALEQVRLEEREKWEEIVTEKDEMIAEKDALIAELIAEKDALIAKIGYSSDK